MNKQAADKLSLQESKWRQLLHFDLDQLLVNSDFWPSSKGSKSMQDSWGQKESSVAASRHSSWEDEEDGGGMWNNAGSQGSGSSWGQGSNGGWGQSNPGKKTSSKAS